MPGTACLHLDFTHLPASLGRHAILCCLAQLASSLQLQLRAHSASVSSSSLTCTEPILCLCLDKHPSQILAFFKVTPPQAQSCPPQAQDPLSTGNPGASISQRNDALFSNVPSCHLALCRPRSSPVILEPLWVCGTLQAMHFSQDANTLTCPTGLLSWNITDACLWGRCQAPGLAS